MEVNARQKTVLVDKIVRLASAKTSPGKTFGVWGLAFKPQTDDMREAPSVQIINGLARARRDHSRFRPRGHGLTAKTIFEDRVALVEDPVRVH